MELNLLQIMNSDGNRHNVVNQIREDWAGNITSLYKSIDSNSCEQNRLRAHSTMKVYLLSAI